MSLPPLVSAAWLEANQASVRIADVRWYLDGRSGHEAYLERHLPGAVWVDLDEVLSEPPTPEAGRHPLAEPERFANGLGALGIGPDDPVVAYDDLGGTSAGRLVWMLRILGSPAALLDGGLPAWSGPLESGAPPAPEPVPYPARPWPGDALASADDAARLAASDHGVVIDSRAPERYRGETEPVDPRAGHIPGAVNRPFGENLGEDGLFLPADQLAQRFDPIQAGGDDTIVYCGSGVSACHNILAMEAAGMARPRLYVGSWSQWSSDPDREAATGDEDDRPA